MTVLALVPAAGDGVRLGAGMPKAFVPIAGTPLVVHAVRNLLRSGSIDHVLVAVREADVARTRDLFEGVPAVEVVVGGADRTESVRSALRFGAERYPAATIALVHDAARALTPPALVSAVVSAVAGGLDAVIPVLPVTDTVKRVDANGAVATTVDRAALRAVQTPQGFRVAVLRRAYAEVAGSATDDAGLVERLGVPVHTVVGDPRAFKITTPWDLRVAELMAESD